MINLKKILKNYQGHSSPASFDFASGDAGYSIFFFEQFLNFQNKPTLDLAIKHLNSALKKESELPLPIPSLYGGSLSLLWIIEKIKKLQINIPQQYYQNYYHARLEQVVKTSKIYLAKPGRFELISGAVGIGLFGFETNNYQLTDIAIEYLMNDVWRAPLKTEFIYRDQFEFFEGINTGIAHGVAGILLFALRLLQNNYQNKKLEILAIAERSYKVLETIYHEKKTHFYPSYYPSTEEPRQLAWCYGDVGIGYALALYENQFHLTPSIGKIVFEKGLKGFLSQSEKTSFLCHGYSSSIMMLNNLKRIGIEYSFDLLENAETLLSPPRSEKFNFLYGQIGEFLALDHVTRGSHLNWENLLLLHKQQSE